MKYNIIMFNMSEFQEWKSGIVNRNYHILHNLLEKEQINKIIAVDFLPYTKKRALRIFMQSILKSPGGKRIHLDLTSRLTQVSDKLYVYSTIDSIFSEKKVYKKLNKLIKKYNLFNNSQKFAKTFECDNNLTIKQSNNLLVWSYFPMFAGFLDKKQWNNGTIEQCQTIFDTVDNWIEHPNFEIYKNRLEHNYCSIEKKANIIFTVSKNLLNRFPNNKNKTWIPNGVDIHHFEKKSDHQVLHVGKPIIGYVGTIEKRLDFDLIKFLSLKNPEKSIVLIGPIWKNAEVNTLKSQENIHFLGRKSYSELPYYINEFDICIIPHKIDQFTKSMNPLKLYEYLACGKPIVTTKVAGCEKFEQFIYTATTKEEFNQKINQALSEKNQDLELQRKESVQQESWKNRINRMLEIISNNLTI